MKPKKLALEYLNSTDRVGQAKSNMLKFFENVSKLAHLRQIQSMDDLEDLLTELKHTYRVYVRMVNIKIEEPTLQLDPAAFESMLADIVPMAKRSQVIGQQKILILN